MYSTIQQIANTKDLLLEDFKHLNQVFIDIKAESIVLSIRSFDLPLIAINKPHTKWTLITGTLPLDVRFGIYLLE